VKRALALLCLSALAACGPLKRCAYEGIGRDEWQQPARVVEALALEPGDRVADLGAGGGYFTFRLADAVGPEGRVYAVDIDESMTEHVRKRAEKEGRANVVTIQAGPDDPKLPPGEIDLVFTSNTYHHLEDRTAYFARLRPALRGRARVAVVEYRPESGWFGGTSSHATGADVIEREMEAAGFRLDASHDFLERQSFIVFSAAPE
jgi:predicted methyltransferase